MKKRRLNKILGTILAITLPLTLIGVVALIFSYPQQDFYKHNGMNKWNINGMWNGPTNHPTETKNYENLTNINLTTYADEVYIRKSNTNTTSIEYSGRNTPNFHQKGTTLNITTPRKIGMHKGTLVIYVSNTIELDIESGASNITIQDLKLADLDIEGGAGNINLLNISVNETIDIKGGVGSIKLSNTTTNKLDLEMGVGSITIDTLSANLVKIEGGVGSITIANSTINTLTTSSGLGSINIGDNNDIKNHLKD